jgi:hypothetical protein
MTGRQFTDGIHFAAGQRPPRDNVQTETSSTPAAIPVAVRPSKAVRPAGPAPRDLRGPDWARVYHVALGVSWVVVAGFFLIWGLDYYVQPLQDRVYDPEHELFKPTGLVGNRLAIAGTSMLAIGVGGYMLRKRWGRLQNLGKLRHWLSAHIWMCTLGPFLITLHTSFKVGGLVSIAFWSMVLVVASGVLGRFVYVRIPKSLNGRQRTMEELASEQRDLAAEIEAESPGLADGVLAPHLAVAPAPSGVVAALAQAVRSDIRARSRRRALRAALAGAGVTPDHRVRLEELTRRYRRLSQERALLVPFERLFRHWHTFHLPLAIVMAAILLVHIAVAIAFGYAWTPG